MAQVPQAHQELQLANTLSKKADTYGIIGALGSLGLVIAGGATDQKALTISGAGVFVISSIVSANFATKSYNSLEKSIWLYNQQVDNR